MIGTLWCARQTFTESCTYAQSLSYFTGHFGHLPVADLRAILRDNALRAYPGLACLLEMSDGSPTQPKRLAQEQFRGGTGLALITNNAQSKHLDRQLQGLCFSPALRSISTAVRKALIAALGVHQGVEFVPGDIALEILARDDPHVFAA